MVTVRVVDSAIPLRPWRRVVSQLTTPPRKAVAHRPRRAIALALLTRSGFGGIRIPRIPLCQRIPIAPIGLQHRVCGAARLRVAVLGRLRHRPLAQSTVSLLTVGPLTPHISRARAASAGFRARGPVAGHPREDETLPAHALRRRGARSTVDGRTALIRGPPTLHPKLGAGLRHARRGATLVDPTPATGLARGARPAVDRPTATVGHRSAHGLDLHTRLG